MLVYYNDPSKVTNLRANRAGYHGLCNFKRLASLEINLRKREAFESQFTYVASPLSSKFYSNGVLFKTTSE